MEFDDLAEHVAFADEHGLINEEEREYLVGEGLLDPDDDEDGSESEVLDGHGPNFWGEALLELGFSACEQSQPDRDTSSIDELTEKLVPVWAEAARRAARKQIQAGCSRRDAAVRFLRAVDRRPLRSPRRRRVHARPASRSRARSPGRRSEPDDDTAPPRRGASLGEWRVALCR